MITVTANPKEYFEKFKDNTINKKYKGMRKDAPGMTFESVSERIIPVREYDNRKIKLPKKKRFKKGFKLGIEK